MPCFQVTEEDDDDWGDDTSEEAVQKRMQELSSAAKVLTINEDVDRPQQQRIDIFYAFVKVQYVVVVSLLVSCIIQKLNKFCHVVVARLAFVLIETCNRMKSEPFRVRLCGFTSTVSRRTRFL